MNGDETRRLSELADQLNAEDPALARLLTASGLPAANRSRHRVLLVASGTLLLTLLVMVMVVGVVTSVPLAVGGGLALFVLGLIGLAAGWWVTRTR